MNLKDFAETYFKLEEKPREILDVYGLGPAVIESISADQIGEQIMINVSTSYYWSGCTDYDSFSFTAEEMNEPIEYFIAKRESEEKAKREEKERMEFERLKQKFEK